MLKQWFDFFTKDVEIDYVIYLRSDPEICLKRINQRNRPEEKDSISLVSIVDEQSDRKLFSEKNRKAKPLLLVAQEYLKNIHELHDKWLIDKDGADKRKKIKEVIVIDASQDLNKLYTLYDCLTEKLLVDEKQPLKI